jgi:cytochrome c553
MEPRAIPGSSKIVFTASAHHSITGGSLVLLDPALGSEGETPIVRLTPEVPFPETEKNIGHFYANPWPLSEEVYLVSWSTARLPAHQRISDPKDNPVNAQGLYVYDRFGNLELLYRDPDLSAMNPIPLTPRSRPLAGGGTELAGTGSAAPEPVGAFLLQDVYEGLEPVERGRVARLRIVGVPPKTQPEMNQPVLGVSREETGKYVLGSVPVERDGSAFFEVPAGVPVFFQALDAQGRALQTMRSLTYVQAGETLACVGCHESRDATPPSRRVPLAAGRPPSLLTPGPEGSWPLRFDRLVQPVLERACVSCHQAGTEGADFLLTPAVAWKNLLDYGGRDLRQLVFERDASTPGASPSKDSLLTAFLETDPVHRDLDLTPDDWRRLRTWMDTYAHIRGSFTDAQDRELEALRKRYGFLLEH